MTTSGGGSGCCAPSSTGPSRTASCACGSRGSRRRTQSRACCSTSWPAAERTPPPGSPRVGPVCGRYASSRSPDDLVEEFEVVETRIAAPLAADYNVAPTKEVYAVVERPPSRESGQDATEPRSEEHTSEL